MHRVTAERKKILEMALTEQIVTVGSWLEDSQLQVKRMTYILDETGTRVAERPPHRHVLAPGDDTTQEDVRVRAVADLLWTPAVIRAYLDNQAKNRIR